MTKIPCILREYDCLVKANNYRAKNIQVFFYNEILQPRYVPMQHNFSDKSIEKITYQLVKHLQGRTGKGR